MDLPSAGRRIYMMYLFALSLAISLIAIPTIIVQKLSISRYRHGLKEVSNFGRQNSGYGYSCHKLCEAILNEV